MKNLKLIALVVAVTISSFSYAATTNNEDPTSELREQIIELLGDYNDTFNTKEVEAEVVFTLNKDSELVIVSVNSEYDQIEWFVKSRLNYKKVKLNSIDEGKIYHMPLTIVNE